MAATSSRPVVLTKAEMKARRLAQTRACRHRQKVAKAVARHDAQRASGRDVIDVYAYHIIDA